MTAPMPESPPKYGWLLSLVMGVAFMLTGGYLLFNEIKNPPTHNAHIYVFVGIAMLGALLVNPAPNISSVKQVVVVIAPIIPWARVTNRPSGSVPPPTDKG